MSKTAAAHAKNLPQPARTADATRAPATPPAGEKPRLIRFIIPLAAFVAIAAVLGVGIKNSGTVGEIKSPLVGKPAPNWSLPVLDQPGRTFGSKELAGKWYVLNFWGSWCFACKDEHQELLKISSSSSVPIIGVDWRDDDGSARNFLDTLGDPYATVATDHDGRVVVDWGVYGAPESFLVNPEGVVVYKKIGPITPEEWNKNFASRLPPGLSDRKS
ncbi:MAG TPA: DsbE family thiol:disulfide interchange protein [Steroidobacteraceae bacterium]|nr:DsbE family thiol:disulfide interchange protein [Steroidobacteraceae bacterium]